MPAASSGFGNGGDAHPTGLQLADDLVGGNETIRSEEAVLFDMAEPVSQRQVYVVKLAEERRVSQPAVDSELTVQQWLDWYAQTTLSKADMDAAVQQWNDSSPMQEGSPFGGLLRLNLPQTDFEFNEEQVRVIALLVWPPKQAW